MKIKSNTTTAFQILKTIANQLLGINIFCTENLLLYQNEIQLEYDYWVSNSQDYWFFKVLIMLIYIYRLTPFEMLRIDIM